MSNLTAGRGGLGEYTTRIVRVDVASLQYPTQRVRQLRTDDETAIGKFIRRFQENTYGANDRLISVALDPDCGATDEDVHKALAHLSQAHPTTPPSLTSIPNVTVMVVDGAHRVAALTSDKVRSLYPEVRARLYTRVDRERFIIDRKSVV